ncbi:MAG: DUF4965 domain-containing protein [Clostridiales bacterium]|jgi:hypothetical protein|nr:DUF4965 domain-containing protein [Clostridiales bacterium]
MSHMKQERVPAVPLITCDPYFSLWSPDDRLTGADTCHWTGKVKRARGLAVVDGAEYRFMGLGGAPAMPQTGLEITATSSRYAFSGGGIDLFVTFLTPLLLSDLDRMSRPVSYIYAEARSADGRAHSVELRFTFSEAFCRDGDEGGGKGGAGGECEDDDGGDESGAAAHSLMNFGVHRLDAGRADGCDAAWIGQKRQAPLSHSGDDVTIDWGYLYLAAPRAQGRVFADGGGLSAVFPLTVAGADGDNESAAGGDSGAGDTAQEQGSAQEARAAQEALLLAAYDDVTSICYFGAMQKGYWARGGKTILDAISEAASEYALIKTRCALFDEDLDRRARTSGGEDYSLILRLAYRQSIAAHKLIADERGDAIFISKECFSNGCAATVDVSYPSTPLYLLYAPELVRAMLRPILRFAASPAWPFDFAPHDAGRYPYVTGQVYGAREHAPNGQVYPPFYQYPSGSDLYRFHNQMPVEECGNMLVMMAAAAAADADTERGAEFAAPHMDLLEKWAGYLLAHGEDPGEQLCTDDFAGHLARNCNLAAKAVAGVFAFGILLEFAGRGEEAARYRGRARAIAKSWTERATAVTTVEPAATAEPAAAAGHMNHTALVFGQSGAFGWSLKYNLIWDRLFNAAGDRDGGDSGGGDADAVRFGRLFDDAVYQNEIRQYLNAQNPYGVPLDSRAAYTKSDWILWVAAFADSPEDRAKLIAPVAAFLRETPDRVPFSDWYDTLTARHHHFQNRTVQGGLFMPLLADSKRLALRGRIRL